MTQPRHRNQHPSEQPSGLASKPTAPRAANSDLGARGDTTATATQPLLGKVALVTGASRGIGRAIATHLAQLGATLALNYNSQTAAAKEAQAEAQAAGANTVTLYQANVGQAEAAQALVDAVVAEHGGLDLLINNAGLQRSAMLHKMSLEDWHAVIDVNLNGPFYLARAALPVMLAAAKQEAETEATDASKEGEGQQVKPKARHIINIASASSFVAQPGAAGYVASKHAIVGFTKALALEAAKHNILVNAVAPGLTETDLVADLNDEQRQRLLRMVPLRRMADPAEVARMVGWVATEATYSTGNVFHVSGGVAMG